MENKKVVQRGWAFYDWANSVYSLVISTAIFPIYYNAVTSSESSNEVEFLGTTWVNTALYSYTLSLSFFIVSILSPLLSGIADASGSKRSFLKFFLTMGSLSCMGLFFFTGDNLLVGLGLSLLSSVGFWGSLVFYNAYLPEVALPAEQDALSAKGFSLGYLGGSSLLIINLLVVTFYQELGLADSLIASRIAFLLVGIWWMGFGFWAVNKLPYNPYRKKLKKGYMLDGFKELKNVWHTMDQQAGLKRFLFSFFFYSMGVQTIILLASLFGDQELGLDSGKLITTILVIQFVAIGGAQIFAFLSRKLGNFQALRIAIFVWILICFGAFLLNKHHPNVDFHFYALGGTVGLVMGGIQSLSRSTYSKMLPKTTSHASYFSFYDVAEKLAIVGGTWTYGSLIVLTGSMKVSALSMGGFFLIGLIILFSVPRSKRVY